MSEASCTFFFKIQSVVKVVFQKFFGHFELNLFDASLNFIVHPFSDLATMCWKLDVKL